MFRRLWRNYWAGAWMVLAGLAAVPLGRLVARVVDRLHVADIVVVWWSAVAASAWTYVVALAGLAVWVVATVFFRTETPASRS